ncbi:MAG: L-2-hydroxyglutarate oxidase [Myxococcota bacterium]
MTDVAVVGAGLVGLATARHLTQKGLRVTVIDKEDRPGAHQSGHNSGVIHSGLYYRPGSLKAELCRRGRNLLEAFCDAHGVPFSRCGKLVAGWSDRETSKLDELCRRGLENGVRCRPMTPDEVQEREPHLAAGARALWVEDTGIVDYRRVAAALAEDLIQMGGTLRLETELIGADGAQGRCRAHVRHRDGADAMEAGLVVTCPGLQSDRVARACGATVDVRIVPFRGEYGVLKPSAGHLVRGLIYPVPDDRFPFLGVHLTRTIAGAVECGPNAVLAFAREGYLASQWSWCDLRETLEWPGFWRLAGRHWWPGMKELWRSSYFPSFVSALRRLVPEIELSDVVPAGAGVRAQAISAQGKLLDDFRFEDGPVGVHVLNAPSPAATSCLAIGEVVARRVLDRLRPGRADREPWPGD